MSNSNKYKHSAHPVIEAGYYHGLQRDVWAATKISKPTVNHAIRTGKASSSKRMTVIETALRLIAERNNKLKQATAAAV